MHLDAVLENVYIIWYFLNRWLYVDIDSKEVIYATMNHDVMVKNCIIYIPSFGAVAVCLCTKWLSHPVEIQHFHRTLRNGVRPPVVLAGSGFVPLGVWLEIEIRMWEFNTDFINVSGLQDIIKLSYFNGEQSLDL